MPEDVIITEMHAYFYTVSERNAHVKNGKRAEYRSPNHLVFHICTPASLGGVRILPMVSVY